MPSVIKYLLLMAFLSGCAQAKELTIHRCVLANGTLAFQEKPCSVKQQSKPQQQKSKKLISKKTVKKSQGLPYKSRRRSPNVTTYQKIASADNSDVSSTWVGDNLRGYRISLPMLKHWMLYKKVFSDKLLHMKVMSEKPGQEMSVLIDVIFPDYKKFSHDELYEIVYLLGSQFIQRSEEQQLMVNKIDVKDGKGMITTVTIKQRNSPFRYISKGTIYKNDWLIQFTINSNDRDSPDYRFMLQSLAESRIQFQ